MIRGRFWLLLLAIVPLYLSWTFDHSLWNPDETRDAGIASEMYRSGRIAAPTLNGEVFLEKPPLYYWSCALIYKLTGRVTAGTTRLPSALYGILGVLFTFLLGRRLFNERVALFAAAMLATSFQYFRMSHFAMMDAALAALVTGSLYFYARGSRVGFALFAVLAFYSKGFLGILLPGLVVTLDLLIQRKPKELLKTIGVGAIFFAVLALPWFWALWKEGGSRYLKIFLIDNHLHRFASSTGDHTEHPFFYYFYSFPGDFMPWSLLFFGFIGDLFARRHSLLASRPHAFTALWFFSLLAFFCVSSSKRSIYLLPLFPAAALLASAWLDEALKKPVEARSFTIFYHASVLIGLVLAVGLTVGGPIINHNFWRSVVVFIPVAALTLLLIRFWREHSKSAACFTLLGLVALCTALAPLAFMERMDADKTFIPLIEAIKSKQNDRTVVGFDMSEMERGVIGFYLDTTFVNVREVDDLRRRLDQTPPHKMLFVINRNKLKDIRPVLEGRAQVVYEYRPKEKTRSYLLYE